MAKPETASGSLEDILTSIRRSLAEQSTDVLTDDSPDREAEPRPAARKEGLVGRLANATAGLAPRNEPAASEDDLADILVVTEPEKAAAPEPAPEPSQPEPPVPVADPPKAAEPAPVPAASEPDPQDPLWFLTRTVEASVAKQAEKPALTRPEEIRSSMPPFFGSGGTARVDTPPAVETVPPRPPFGSAAGPVLTDPAIQREVSLVAAAAATAARSGSATAVNGTWPPAAVSPLQGSQALEVMVLDLLKPMLREWLDQNMPRMVAEALKAESDRVGAGGSAKKP